MPMRMALRDRGGKPSRGLVLAAAAASLLAWTGSAVAQEPCEGALRQAENSYELGLFEVVPTQLDACLKGRPSRTDLVRAQALLAKSYIAADQPEKAREAVTELLRVDPTYEPQPPPQFATLVEEIRPSVLESQVATVSKTSESLREAPATVVVIRAKEIEERGYLDLEQVLHDLPGFDISRGNGETYSNFYQRGLRSKDNDRILLLVDGVEQNDLATSVAHLSRQYPVSNVDRLEVVYGPASTIYGANAFSGVINIVTKQPEAFLPKGKRFGAAVQAANGSFNTRYTDLALAGRDRSGSVAWSVTGRLYRSDEMDLSRFEGRSYDFGKVPYKDLMRLAGADADFFCLFGACDNPQDLFEVSNENGTQVVNLTDAGEQLARQQDQRLALNFSDPTRDWSVYAKLRLPHLAVGLQAWSREEGVAPWYNGANSFHGPASWAPEHRSLFLRYTRPLGKNLSFNLFTRYRQSALESNGSARNELWTYASGVRGLFDLVYGCLVQVAIPQYPYFEYQYLPPPCESFVFKDNFSQLATQSTAEATLVYSPSGEFTLVSGVDLRHGSTQTRREFVGQVYVHEVLDHTDLAVYSQASYKPVPTLNLVAGGRVDYNDASSPNYPYAGFGTVFTPRLALVYLPGPYSFKIIYSEAFKNPSDYEKYSPGRSGSGEANPDLDLERTRSLEVSAGWYPEDGTSLELAAYRTLYESLVDLVFTEVKLCFPPNGSNCFEYLDEHYQNIFDIEVRGIELRGEARAGKASLFGNITYIDPHATMLATETSQGGSGLRVGDIASNKANLGVQVPLWERVGLNLRWNYVGSRRTGAGTTVSKNPLHRIDGYSVANAALTYKDAVPGVALQLILNNLLDEAYEDPGVGTADGNDLAASIPQAGRTVYLRLSWGLGRSRQAPQDND